MGSRQGGRGDFRFKVSLVSPCLQMNAELQEELLLLLRSQQREIADLRGHMDNMQSSVTAHVEHVMAIHQEQERIFHTITKIRLKRPSHVNSGGSNMSLEHESHGLIFHV